MAFDPDAAARPGSGIFGLECTPEQSAIILTPVPFDATTSYRAGAARGPDAILEASRQVDLFDHRFGRVYEQGICMLPIDAEIAECSASTRALAEPILARGGAGPGDADAVARIDAAGEQVNAYVHRHVARILAEGRIPGVVGGDHSVSFGAIRACAEHAGNLGVLHLDAHMDLREAFEGFRWSHASVMHNVLTRVPEVSRLVQVGIRDFAEGERAAARAQSPRVVVMYDDAWAEAIARGTAFIDLARQAIHHLPDNVYVSFDIDALDPSLCPHTGTPVPGGLSFNQAVLILALVRDSGRRIVGFDLVEVAPGPAGDEWDAIVGARMLYKLCGMARPRTAPRGSGVSGGR